MKKIKEVIRPFLKKYREHIQIAGALIISVVMMMMVWIMFPSNLDNVRAPLSTNKVKPAANINTSVTRPASLVVPHLVPDYSIPSTVDGMSPVVYRLATNQDVVFLGIDDGEYKDQSVIDIMRDNNIKASLFLSKTFISDNPGFFNALVAQGSYIENHTLSHNTRMSTEMSFDQQKAEICGMADYEQLQFGRRPTLFRPPGGAYSDTMRMAAAACGMKAVVTWVAKANGGSMQYQFGNSLRPGDVVLMHFRPEFKTDMQAFVDAMKAANLHTALLEDAL